MRVPLDLPAPVRAAIEERASRLTRFYGRILRCRATVEGPGAHHRQGRIQLRLSIAVPGRQIVITRQGGDRPLEAVREAFRAAERTIQDHIRRARGYVKTHADRPRRPR